MAVATKKHLIDGDLINLLKQISTKLWLQRNIPTEVAKASKKTEQHQTL